MTRRMFLKAGTATGWLYYLQVKCLLTSQFSIAFVNVHPVEGSFFAVFRRG